MNPLLDQDVDPIAARAKRLRASRGWTLAQLAARVADELVPVGTPRPSAPRSRTGSRRSISTTYLWLIENGRKVPNEPIAEALAVALGENPLLYRAWVKARKRADLGAALEAAATVRRLLDQAASIEESSAPLRPRGRRATGDASPARLRVPVIASGADPGDAVRPACDILAWLRLDERQLPAGARARLDRPFAIRMEHEVLGRVRGRFFPGDRVLVLRDFMPLSTHDVHAVRHEGRVLLSRVLWNGHQLLLLPGEGESDFVVVEAPSDAEVRARILGVAVALRHALEEVAP